MAIDFHGWNSQIPVPSLGQPSGLPNFSIPQAHNLPADSFYDSSVDLEQIMRTGAVASDNRDSPFLSASEAHWLFNNEGQRSVPMVQASPDEMDQPMAQTQAYMDPLPGRQSNASSDEGAPALPRSMSWPALNDRKTALPKAAPYLAPLIPPMPRQVVVTAAARDKMLDYFKVCEIIGRSEHADIAIGLAWSCERPQIRPAQSGRLHRPILRMGHGALGDRTQTDIRVSNIASLPGTLLTVQAA